MKPIDTSRKAASFDMAFTLVNMPPSQQRGKKLSAISLSLTGIILVLAAALFNCRLIQWVRPSALARSEIVEKIHVSQWSYLIGGLGFLALGQIALRVNVIGRIAQRPLFAKLLLAILVLVVPIGGLELALRPWAIISSQTTLYMRDPELGWRHRPGARDFWEQVPVSINAKGLRGPELPYAKPTSVRRIVFLGDSVTFGEKIADDAAPFPFRVPAELSGRLPWPIEALNAGVSGYSTWQESLMLKQEMFKYDPDLVIVAFVLNDVTEQIELKRFGGFWEGWQLSRSYSSWLEWVLHKSAVIYFADRVAGRLRYGSDVRAEAKHRETLEVQTLVDHPDRPEVVQAWKKALDDLTSLYDSCKARRCPVALVIFPFTFQFDDPAAGSGPQRILARQASEMGVPFLDLLPPMVADLANQRRPVKDYFLDTNHLTTFGNERVGRMIADFIVEERLFVAAQAQKRP